jgi:hypothetical protein
MHPSLSYLARRCFLGAAPLLLALMGCDGTTEVAEVATPSTPSMTGRWAAVTAGTAHTCALTTGGEAYCWGANRYGQLGDGTNTDRDVPVRVAGGHTFTMLSASYLGTCGVATTGEAYCWGRSNSLRAPVAVAPGHRFISVHSGGASPMACGVEQSGDIYCWAFWTSPGPQEISQQGPFTRVIANDPCGLTPGGQVLCWALFGLSSTPGDHGAPPGTVGLSGGRWITCVWTAAGAAWCPTEAYHNRAGTFWFGPYKPVPGGIRFTQVSAGDRSCGLAEDGQAYCWTVTVVYALPGDPASQGSLGTPVAVGGKLRFKQIAAGDEHVCALTAQGAIYCWGSNASGQLGVGRMGGTGIEPARVRDPRPSSRDP